MSKKNNPLRKGNRKHYDYDVTNSRHLAQKLRAEVFTCARKIGHTLIYDAYEAAFCSQESCNVAYDVYICDFCGAFHVGKIYLGDGKLVKPSSRVFFNGTQSKPVLVDHTSKPVAWAVMGELGRIRMFFSTNADLERWIPICKKQSG